jgi:uncharacterized membrane protein YoaK (UPF0700 family)
VLAAIAGMINTVGYMGFRHEAVSHLTGTTTLLGIALSSADAAQSVHWLLVLVAFVAGAALSGIIVQNQALELGRRYGVALLIESALLFVATPLVYGDHDLGLYLAATACGLQNAMASTYSGTVLRTTHLSGSFTDFGIAIGQLLRGIEPDGLRIRLSGMLIASFLIGSTLGGVCFARLHELTLLVPAILTGVLGVAYQLYLRKRTDIHVPG